MDLVCVTVDCTDPVAVATFWGAALHWEMQVAADGTGAVCRSPAGGAYLEFVRVPESKTTKNRLHLGCTAGALDQLDIEIARLRSLGATIAWEEEFPPDVADSYRNVVMRDVEGNEFCLGAGSFRRSRREDVSVREAIPHDREFVVRLAKRLAATTPAWRDHHTISQAIAASTEALFDRPQRDATTLVAHTASTVVGFITLSTRQHFTGAVDASIDDLVVADGWEGRGVAQSLLDSAEAWASDRGYALITVETSATNGRALRRYRSHGFLDEDVRLTKKVTGGRPR